MPNGQPAEQGGSTKTQRYRIDWAAVDDITDRILRHAKNLK